MRQLPWAFVAISFISTAQNADDYAVMLQASVSTSPLEIQLTWDLDPNATEYAVFRKDIGAATWGVPLALVSGSDTEYVDVSVTEAQGYEYRVMKTANGYTGYGYVHSGINVALDHEHGRMLLIIEETLAQNLGQEIDLLTEDLRAEGWRVQTQTVDGDTTVDYVKSIITGVYNSPGSLEMIYLLGHVPVPYSGNIYPDGHSDHMGAWPADVYYAETDGLWTDINVNNNSANDFRNHNLPGDGKFDQNSTPGEAELMIGRVDFSNLPVFAESETVLTKRYLDRVHAYKHGIWTLPKRALIDDNFGGFGGEAFASNGWRNFSPLIGRENIFSLDYRTDMASQGYLFSYGCGGGWHTSAGGIGSSSDFAGDSLRTGFTMLFGSYFGDWDRQDNLLRSALAQGTTLSISWAGRPYWFYHSMGMGYPLGYSARLTQNNNGLYYASFGAKSVHIALLGDPSLRLEYIAPPANLAADSTDTFHINLHWTVSAGAVAGYHVYRSDNGSPFFQLTSSPVTDTAYLDSCVIFTGTYRYMVRAVELVQNFSGSYFNLSLGIFDSVTIHSGKYLDAEAEVVEEPGHVLFVSHTPWATHHQWVVEGDTFSGDSVLYQPVIDAGKLAYVYTASNVCGSDVYYGAYYLGTGEPADITGPRLYPNPVRPGQQVNITGAETSVSVSLFGMDGRLVREVGLVDHTFTVPILPAGVYIVHMETAGALSLQKLIVR